MIVLGLMALAWSFGLQERINLQSFQTHKEELLSFVANKPVLSALVFMGVYIAAVALSLPVATLLTLTVGFLFGKRLGLIYVVSGATVGASVIFLVAQSALGETLRAKAGGLYQKIEKNMKENAFGYLLFLRLVPVFPFFLVNIVAALFNLPLRIFAAATLFGIIPGSFIFVNLGRTLGEMKSLNDLVSVKTLLAFVLLGVFALIPTLYKQMKTNIKE
mgnify:CR=1 FL=1